MRWRTYCLAAVLGLTWGCAAYHLGPVNGATAGDQSIEVAPFNNQTLQPRLGDSLTQATRECLQQDGTYHLATHGEGDIRLTGVIQAYQRSAIGYLSTDAVTPEDFQVGMDVHVTAYDVDTGKVLLDKVIHAFTLVHVGSDLASAERQAMPLLAEDAAQKINELISEGSW